MQSPKDTAFDALGAFEQTVRTYQYYPDEAFRRERLDEIAAAKAWLRTVPTDTSPLDGPGVGGRA